MRKPNPNPHRVESQPVTRGSDKRSILVLRVILERSGKGIIQQYEVAGTDNGLTHEVRVILERVGG